MADKLTPRRVGSARRRAAGNLRQPVAREVRRPRRLTAFGAAGARVAVDDLLEARHGVPRKDWVALGPTGVRVLHLIASGREPHDFRSSAIGALAVIASAASIAVLAEVARDQRENPMIRVSSARALGAIPGRSSVGVLLELLGDAEPLVRHRAAASLGQLGDRRALEPLRSLAAAEKSGLVQEAAVTAAERIQLLHELSARDTRRTRR